MALTAADRVILIKEIANRLKTEDWSVIDLVLRQFGLPTGTGGARQDRIFGGVDAAPDATLVDLAQHLGFAFAVAAPLSAVANPGFWEPGMLRVFMSHLARHKGFAGSLQAALAQRGISAFVAHNDIEPTKEWQVEIELALKTCESLVALLHPEFHKSNWTDQEIGFVMGRGLPAFAVGFEDDPYGFIARFQAFDGRGKAAPALADELFQAYCVHPQTRQRMSEAVVTLFENSGSFAQAKERIGLLEQIEHWEPAFGDRLEEAAESNSQVRGAFGVPARVTSLIRRRSRS